MENILIAVLSSTVLSTLINFLQQQYQAKNNHNQSKDARGQVVADRLYEQLRSEIDELKKHLKDSQHRAQKWQEMYYQLYSKYQILMAQGELSTNEINELKKKLLRLENLIKAKEQTS